MKRKPKWDMLIAKPFTWESQASQFVWREPEKKGINLELHSLGTLGNLVTIDCLLYRDDNGILRGILYHYPTTYADASGIVEKAGNANLFVDPVFQRQGIGTALLRHAMTLWDIDFRQQRYSIAGLALMLKVTGND